MRDKNLHATTRNGYYPPTAATQNLALTEPPKQANNQLRMEISSAVNSAITYNGLDVKAVKSGDGYVLEVKGKDLDWTSLDAEKQKTEVTVIAAWYSSKNQLLGHAGKELVATRAVPEDAATGSDATFTVPVALTGNPVRLRFVVRDAVNGRIGTVDVKP